MVISLGLPRPGGRGRLCRFSCSMAPSHHEDVAQRQSVRPAAGRSPVRFRSSSPLDSSTGRAVGSQSTGRGFESRSKNALKRRLEREGREGDRAEERREGFGRSAEPRPPLSRLRAGEDTGAGQGRAARLPGRGSASPLRPPPSARTDASIAGPPRQGGSPSGRPFSRWIRHCEGRSDAAIQLPLPRRQHWIASRRSQ